METTSLRLPNANGLFYGGAWHPAISGRTVGAINPATGEELMTVAVAGAADVDRAVAAAQDGFRIWRDVRPLERARLLRVLAERIRSHAAELALLDAADSGNPVSEMRNDAFFAAAFLDFYAGLVTEMKGASIPMGPNAVNFSVREPWGVIARIAAFNHPFLFAASKLAAPLAAGNTVIVKPAEQAPLSGLRLGELCADLFPPGVVSIVNGDREAGAALATHPGVAMVTLVGSIPTGRAVMRGASDTLKPVLMELGGKNALIAYPDADLDRLADGIVGGMNFTWCGQSCGSMSRVFLHDDIYDAVVARLPERVARFRPGIPTDPSTTMGCVVDGVQHARILEFINSAVNEGAHLLCGGKQPEDPALSEGFFIEPTIFTEVTPSMRIAREEIFGPVQAILRWRDEDEMFDAVNGLEYGLTGAIFTENLTIAHRAAARVEAGYIWVNTVSSHFLGAPFGGFKQSGIGREECLSELLEFTREKNIHIKLGE
jgi:betaine-aldehyde dehydrogenase